MEPWQLIVSLIQGITEWLPVSSEGQVMLFLSALGEIPPESLLTLAVWLHLGTSMAVIVRYPRDVFNVVALRDRILTKRLLIATLATAITAIPTYFLLRQALTDFQGEVMNVIVGLLLLITGLMLYLPERKNPMQSQNDLGEVTDRKAALVGLIQGFSVLPGLSRSGVTISALLLQKVDKEKALRFSFLMSLPAVIGILGVEILTGNAVLPAITPMDLFLMEAVVFVAGLVMMDLLLRLAKRIRFWAFCVILGVIVLVLGIPVVI